MQVWTVASGKTARIASGKPFRPSTTASRISSTPRFRSSFMTRSQNLAPSFCSSQRPRISLAPSARTPSAMWTALLRTRPSSRTLTLKRVEEDQRIDGLQRSGLPGGDLLQNSVRHRADQVGRDLDAVELAQMPDDLAGAHAAGIHRHDLVVEAGEAALILGDELRVEASPADPAGSPARSCRYRSSPSCGHSRCGCCRPRPTTGDDPSRRSAPARPTPSSDRREGRSASKAVFGSAPASSWSRSASGMRGVLRRAIGNLLGIHYGRPHTKIPTLPQNATETSATRRSTTPRSAISP